MPFDDALQQLMSLPEEDRLAALLAFEAKRKEKNAALYWATDAGEKYQRFYDQIEYDFAKFTPEIKIYALLGGNRSSKTERGAFLAVAWLMGKEYFRDEPSWRYVKDLPIPEEGVNIWCVGLDYTIIRDVIWQEKLRTGTRKNGLLPPTGSPFITRVSDSEFQISVNVNGRKSTLLCKSAESGREKFQSASVDFLWIDEEIDADVFDEAYQRTVDCGGKILLTLTPLADVGSGSKKPWVHDLFKEFNAGRKDLCFVKLNTLDNPYIPEEEKEKLKIKWAGHPEEKARLFGDFIHRAGLVYDNFSRGIHVIKPFRLESDWKRIVSIDPAPTGVTAAVWAAISPRNDIYIYRVYYESNKIISDHAKDILIRNGSDKVDIWLIDPFFGIQRNAETHHTGMQLYRDAGIPVRLAPRAEDFGREILREYFEASRDKNSRNPKIFLIEGKTDSLVKEIEQYSWDTYQKGAMKGQTKGKPVKRHDHAINAVQYLVSLRPRGKKGSSGAGVYNASNSYT
jgi:phage terminase large subunit-like protein